MDKQIKQYVIRVLAKRSMLSAELRDKLVRKGFAQSEIDEVITYCQERGYLDDAAYETRFMAHQLKQGRSYQMALHKCRQKQRGPSVNTVLDPLEKRTFDQHALETYLKKCTKELASSDVSVRRRLLRRLLQRGFSWDLLQANGLIISNSSFESRSV